MAEIHRSLETIRFIWQGNVCLHISEGWECRLCCVKLALNSDDSLACAEEEFSWNEESFSGELANTACDCFQYHRVCFDLHEDFICHTAG
jgi:hypothetical protein